MLDFEGIENTMLLQALFIFCNVYLLEMSLKLVKTGDNYIKSNPKDYNNLTTFIIGITDQPMLPKGVICEGCLDEKHNSIEEY